MSLGYAVPLRNARVDLVRAAMDNGSGVSSIQFFSGTRPGTGGSVTSGNALLGTLQFPTPCGISAAGVLTFTAITPLQVVLSGTPTWFRLLDCNGAFVADGSVGVTGADVNFPSVAWVAGQALALSALTVTEGNA